MSLCKSAYSLVCANFPFVLQQVLLLSYIKYSNGSTHCIMKLSSATWLRDVEWEYKFSYFLKIKAEIWSCLKVFFLYKVQHDFLQIGKGNNWWHGEGLFLNWESNLIKKNCTYYSTIKSSDKKKTIFIYSSSTYSCFSGSRHQTILYPFLWGLWHAANSANFLWYSDQNTSHMGVSFFKSLFGRNASKDIFLDHFLSTKMHYTFEQDLSG